MRDILVVKADGCRVKKLMIALERDEDWETV